MPYASYFHFYSLIILITVINVVVLNGNGGTIFLLLVHFHWCLGIFGYPGEFYQKSPRFLIPVAVENALL